MANRTAQSAAQPRKRFSRPVIVLLAASAPYNETSGLFFNGPGGGKLPSASRLRAMGIRDCPISPRSPWQNGYAERCQGRECDRYSRKRAFLAHLRQILSMYAIYYNGSRTHLSLHKDAPLHRAIQRSGTFVAVPVLGGLHHRDARI
jgi:hypothetical protein